MSLLPTTTNDSPTLTKGHMYLRIALFAALLGGCPSHPDWEVIPPGPVAPDAKVYEDAPADAKVYGDAPLDAFVPQDAAPVRSCTQSNPILNNGTETFTLTFACGDPSDAGLVQGTLSAVATGSGSDPQMQALQFQLTCGTPFYTPVNRFITFQATELMHFTHVTGALFDVECF